LVGKRGFFYTIVTVLLILLLLVVLNFKFEHGTTQSERGVKARVVSMNRFLKDLEDDLSRVSYITGYRALVGLVDYVIERGEYIDDVQTRLVEIFENGTVGGEQLQVLENHTFGEWVTRVQSIANSYAINLSVTLNSVEFRMVSPWSIDLSINISVLLLDSKGIASWNTSIAQTTSLSILGLEDPVYPIMSYGRVFNTINITPYSYFVNGTNTTNLKRHINHSYYIASSVAPNFLMRLEGNFTASEYGIESLVYLPEFSAQGLVTYERSCVDYLYANASTRAVHIINNTYEDWFRLDTEHLAVYQCEDITK